MALGSGFPTQRSCEHGKNREEVLANMMRDSERPSMIVRSRFYYL